MAFGYNPYQQYYQPQQQYMPQQITNQPQQQNDGITWVQGENSAKSYPVAAGRSVLLMAGVISSVSFFVIENLYILSGLLGASVDNLLVPVSVKKWEVLIEKR